MRRARQPCRIITVILTTLSRPCTRLSWTTLLDRRMHVYSFPVVIYRSPSQMRASSISGRHHAADTLWDPARQSGSGSSGYFPCIRRRSTCPGVSINNRALRRRGPMATKKQKAQSLPPQPAVAEGLPPGASVQFGSRKNGTDGAARSAVLAASLSVSRRRR